MGSQRVGHSWATFNFMCVCVCVYVYVYVCVCIYIYTHTYSFSLLLTFNLKKKNPCVIPELRHTNLCQLVWKICSGYQKEFNIVRESFKVRSLYLLSLNLSLFLFINMTFGSSFLFSFSFPFCSPSSVPIPTSFHGHSGGRKGFLLFTRFCLPTPIMNGMSSLESKFFHITRLACLFADFFQVNWWVLFDL